MKKKTLIVIILILILAAAAAWFFWFRPCGIENCHGLNITCGTNIAKVCTENYAIGDGCRRYASCEIIGGKCQLAKSEKFDTCKSCIEKYLQNSKNLQRCLRLHQLSELINPIRAY